jgi:hypothetical protein
MSSRKLPATGHTAIIEVTPRKKPRGKNAYITRTSKYSSPKKHTTSVKKVKLHHDKEDDCDSGHFQRTLP